MKNICTGVAETANGLYNTASALTPEQPEATLFAVCATVRKAVCTMAITVCDNPRSPQSTVAITVPAQTAQSAPTPNLNFLLVGSSYYRGYRVAVASMFFAIFVVSVLLLWILASIFLATSARAFKRKLAISAWIGGPTVIFFMVWIPFPYLFGTTDFFFPVSLMFLWTNVFAPLSIGVTLRRRLFPRSPSPDPLSLPLATLAFAIPTAGAIYLLIEFGIFANPGNCAIPDPVFTACGLYEQEEPILGAAVLLLLTIFGALLPANSNVVLAYDRMHAFLSELPSRSRP